MPGARMARDPYRRQMRRMRRAMRKGEYNPYAVLIVGPDEPFAFIALAAIGKWAYRHRSACAPFIIALAAFITAALAHGHHARWWIPITIATSVTTVLLGFPHSMLRRHPAGRRIARILAWLWERCGIDRALERAYAGTVIAVVGGWLATAIAYGPMAKPLPLTALIATVILGIPWWFHRRRRAKVRVERTISGWPDIATDVGLPGSHIASVVVDAWGWTARVILKKGTTTAQAIAKIPEIESGLGLRPGSVRVFPDDKRADRFIMRVVENDPHAQVIPWPGPSITSITQLAEIGVSEDGRPVRVLLLRRNVLIGGIMGSGKSGILNIIIAILAACRDVVLWGVDLKGGMELQPWAVCFDRLAVTPEDANQLFRDAVGRLNERAARMAAEGKRVWEPTPDDPALVIITDEHAELPEESHDCADSIARRGRAVAVNLMAATQRPTQAAMGKNTAVRSQMDVRICLRVREPRDADLIMGQGSVNSGWHAHKLTKPGEFLISSPEHGLPERNRAYLLSDERRDQHAAACAIRRPRLTADAPEAPLMAPGSPQTAAEAPTRTERPTPETALWGALTAAGPDGATVRDLMAACGMSRSWVYYRLREHADAGRAVQTAPGTWRAIRPPGAASGPPDGRPPGRPHSPRPPGRPPSGRRSAW
jgi:DNA segregation ATPase FtsK/SpoIIIE, S-DNA-T family